MATQVPTAKKDSTNLTPSINLSKNYQKQHNENVSDIKAILQILTAVSLLNNNIENYIDEFNKQTKEKNKQTINLIKELSEQEKQLSESLKLSK